MNATDVEYVVKQHERVAQFVAVKNALVRPVLTDKESLTETSRGTGGFGSTGV
jgi:dUTPase